MPLPLMILVCLCCLPALASGESTCFTANCHRAIMELKHLHAPVRDENCLACHVRITTTHPILVGNGKSFGLVAEGAKLCEKCHDALGRKRVVHGPVREGKCLACHRAHGASGEQLLDVGDDQTSFCLGCHDPASFKGQFMHGPVATGECTKCHNPHESSEPGLLPAKGRDLCLRCHADFAKAMAAATVVHPPVSERPCTSCHTPHSSPAAHILKKKMPDLCTDCHEQVARKLSEATVQHKPLQSKESCGSCHSPHFSTTKGLLPNTEQEVCLGCHGSDSLGSPPLSNLKKELASKKDLHAPVKNGTCDSCHDPHGSPYGKILKGPYPAQFYAPYKEGDYDFCLSCHDKSMLKFPETTIYTKFRNGNRNLHYVHVVHKRKGRTCRACHEPHAGDGLKLIGKNGPRFGDWRIPIRHTMTPTGGSCAPGCHRKFDYDREKAVDYLKDQKK
ncbi:cytochrome c3 family protein [Geotalea sp. SG265]|uniref:cytochrome c3 family protein n=1 Tax=Geotalea sp. SG265 TaxID=2922867 RepID=UPI001FAFB91A|nr:cytochrome c3 family protein [Geotalea sp. SG265]